jgi:hypothetical protein
VDDVCIFYVPLVDLRPFIGIFINHLVYFPVIWYISSRFGIFFTKKNLATRSGTYPTSIPRASASVQTMKSRFPDLNWARTLARLSWAWTKKQGKKKGPLKVAEGMN